MTRVRRLPLAVLIWALLAGPSVAAAQTTPVYSAMPTLRQPDTGLVITYNVGAATLGGFQQVIQSGSITVADNKQNCQMPQFVSCNIVYWPGTGTTLATTLYPATAFQAGNVVAGYVTTYNGNVTGVYTPALTSQLPPGMAVTNSVGLRLPLCNAVLKKNCQAAVNTLSGY